MLSSAIDSGDRLRRPIIGEARSGELRSGVAGASVSEYRGTDKASRRGMSAGVDENNQRSCQFDRDESHDILDDLYAQF